MLKKLCLVLGAVLSTISLSAGEKGFAAKGRYRGWDTFELNNGLIELHAVPALGGRVIQLKLSGYEFFWVNDQLAGRMPPPSGVGPEGEWLNYGGEKLWPAPQGWDGEDKWPGPPDPVLDGSPHKARLLESGDGIHVESKKDPGTGIRFKRDIRIFEGSTRVHVKAVMENIDTKPRRWGIWSVAQLDGEAKEGGEPVEKLKAYCPMNAESKYPKGYKVLYGLVNNPQFQPDYETGILTVHYKHLVGKVGLDSKAGWVATVNGESGMVFVQRFSWHKSRPYPDGSSVEIWTQGRGTIAAWGKLTHMPEDPSENPFLIESEILSPFCELAPGESCCFHYDWYTASLGGDFPVVDCSQFCVVSEPFAFSKMGEKVRLKGRFGVFCQGKAFVVPLNGKGDYSAGKLYSEAAMPDRPLVLNGKTIELEGRAKRLDPEIGLALILKDKRGNKIGELGRFKQDS